MAKSPIVELGLKDRNPRAGSADDALFIFLVRAYEFWEHPAFQGEYICPDRVLVDSLAFRVRPLLMTDADDGSIWGTLDRYEKCGGDRVLANRLRQQTKRWFELTPEALGVAPPPLLDLPTIAQQQVQMPPREVLWDYVYGFGVHTDHQRVLRTVLASWPGAATDEFREYMGQIVLGMLRAARPLVIEVHNAVLDLVSTSDPSAESL